MTWLHPLYAKFIASVEDAVVRPEDAPPDPRMALLNSCAPCGVKWDGPGGCWAPGHIDYERR